MNMGGWTTRMPHVLLIPFPGQGHINPMMHLAWKLVSDGFLVTFVNTDFNHQRIMEATKNNKSMHNYSNMIRMVSVPDGLPPSDMRKDILKLMQALENIMFPSVVDKLIQDINDSEEEHKLTCMIADVSICFGLQQVADLHRISLAGFHTALASNFALRFFSSRFVSLGILNSDGTPKEDKIVKFLPSLPPLYSGHLPWLYGGEYRFRLGIRMGEEVKQIKWILFNSFYELEAPAVDELSKEVGVYPIGPLIPSEFLSGDQSSPTKVLPSFWADEVECLEWLDKQSTKSVIYVSFGSIVVWSERQLEEFALGLENTQRPFLWVLRSDLMEGEKAVLPQGFLERIRDRGHIVSWAPQVRVLSHPSIACFVTHCGWNSVQESITMGVPMLCLPYFTDQFLNRTYIVDVWKVGLPLGENKGGIIEKEEFSKGVERLLAGEEGVEMRKKVGKMKKIARETVEVGGSSFNNYNLFVNAVKNKRIE